MWMPKSSRNISDALGHEIQIENSTEILQRRHGLKRLNLQCDKSEEWYGKTMMLKPFTNPEIFEILHSGKLQCGDDNCLDVRIDGTLHVKKCDSDSPEFQLTKHGFLKHVKTGNCVMANKHYHMITTCVEDLSNHLWVYMENGYLLNLGSVRCLMQMSDVHDNEQQLPIGQQCDTIEEENQIFARWKFKKGRLYT